MRPLKELFDVLNNRDHCVYASPGSYATPSGQCVEGFTCLESLEVFRDSPHERVTIGYFGKGSPTRISFVGEDAKAMKETIESIGLPSSWPENMGEKVFYGFRQALKGLDGSVHLEQEVAPGKENQLRLVLEKLVGIYSS